jgi:hypothetical protein
MKQKLRIFFRKRFQLQRLTWSRYNEEYSVRDTLSVLTLVIFRSVVAVAVNLRSLLGGHAIIKVQICTGPRPQVVLIPDPTHTGACYPGGRW